MIILDIETSGLRPEENGIWQIGAVDFYNPENIFLDECRIDQEDKVEEVPKPAKKGILNAIQQFFKRISEI